MSFVTEVLTDGARVVEVGLRGPRGDTLSVFVNDFRQPGDSASNWLDAFHRARDYLYAGNGGVIEAPDSVYPVLDTLNLRDAPKPVKLRGSGKFSTLIYGNFTGPSKYVVDVGFSKNSLRIQGCDVEHLSICGNGVLGDPRGLGAHRSFQQNFDNVHIVGPSAETICGAGRSLWNTALVATQINNSKFSRIAAKGSWAPSAFSLTSTVRFSGSGTSITSSENCFTSAMTGQYIVLPSGSGSSDLFDYFVAKLTYVSATSATLDTPLGTSISSVRGSVGFITGSISNGGTTLTLDMPVAVSGMVGLLIGIHGADVKTDAGNTKGWLWTEVSAYGDTSTLTLRDAATAAVTSGLVIFAPSCFFGTPKFEASENRQTNDFQIWGMQIEGGVSAGMVFSRVINARVKQTKIEMQDFGNGGNAKNRAVVPLILDEIKEFSWQDGDINFGAHPVYGAVLVSGSRGYVDLKEVNRSGYLPGQPLIHVTDEVTASFKATLEDWRLSDGLTKMSAAYTPQRVPAAHPRAVDLKRIVGRLVDDPSWGYDNAHPGYISGRYYNNVIGYTPLTPASAQSADTIYVFPITINEPVWIQALGVRISTSVASSHALVGIYENVRAETGFARPGKLLAGAPPIDTSVSAASVESALTPNLLIPHRGPYWMAVLCDGATQLRAISGADYKFAGYAGGGSGDQLMANTGENCGFMKSQTYSGGLPADLTRSSWTALATAICPLAFWRVA